MLASSHLSLYHIRDNKANIFKSVEGFYFVESCCRAMYSSPPSTPFHQSSANNELNIKSGLAPGLSCYWPLFLSLMFLSYPSYRHNKESQPRCNSVHTSSVMTARNWTLCIMLRSVELYNKICVSINVTKTLLILTIIKEFEVFN